jgi:hypothetical protein
LAGADQNGVFRRQLEETIAAVRQSESLSRKPNQARLFDFLANRLLEGAVEPVKEYVLGVEALGRPAYFDPKTDSIVRVEIRKLRRTLEEHFSGPGKDQPLLLRVPKGAYSLEAVARGGPARHEEKRTRRRAIAWLGASVVITLAGVSLWTVLRAREPSVPRPTAGVRLVGSLAPGAVRILAGNLTEGFTDGAGREWSADRYFEGGIATRQADVQVVNVDEPRLFRHQREGQFQYHIPLKPGLYELRLYFAETLYGQGAPAGGGEVSRLFRVMINGQVAYEPLDVCAEAPGRGVAMRKVFLNVSPAQDGKLHLGFEVLRPDKPFVNAIEIVPGLRDRMLPVRMVAAAQPAVDANGDLWEPDSFVLGGRRVPRSREIRGAPAAALFRSERFGHFQYHLHAVKGHRYRLTLWMAEQYFGYPESSATAYRLFDVWANGATLMRSFHLLREAGGSGRAVRKTFSGLRTDAYGAIRLSFVPVRNYALINALELIDEGPQ